MSEVKHSPLPWDVSGFDDEVFIVDAERMQVVKADGLETTADEDFANARRIVEAANEHAELVAQRDELLAACRAALPNLRWANIHGSRCDAEIDKLLTAIANAEKGTVDA